MMWELTLDEWEKTLTLGLIHPFMGMHDGVEHSMSID